MVLFTILAHTSVTPVQQVNLANLDNYISPQFSSRLGHEACWSRSGTCDLSRFSPQFDRIFPGKAHLFQFLAEKMLDIRNFVLHKCIINFEAEQVYFKLQVTNVKNKEVTSNPKPKTPEKIGLSKTLNPKP